MRSLLVLLFACVACAQTFVRLPSPFFELKQFLELTDGQYGQIIQNLEEYRRTLTSYERRVDELRRDIAVETAREHPSSTELGTRYVEVEINCRLMTEEGAKLRAGNQALLTAAQKTKLQVLLDAIKLMPLVGQAQEVSLVEATPGLRITATRVPGIVEVTFIPPPSPVCGAGTYAISGR